MVFVDTIYDQNGCHCSQIYNYDDIILQAQFTILNSANYKYYVKILAYELDGLTLIGDVTNDFSYASSIITNGNIGYINIQSKRIGDLICSAKCFRLKVEVKGTLVSNNVQLTEVLFNKFTSCMQVDNCCVTIPPSGIIVRPYLERPLPQMMFDVNDDMDLIYSADEITQEDYVFSLNEDGDLILTVDSQEKLDGIDLEIDYDNGTLINNK